MIKAILLDLDDTLIHNPTMAFMLAYFAQVDAHFGALWGERPYSQLLSASVRRLMFDPVTDVTTLQHSNLTRILAGLAAEIDRTPAEVLAALSDFYAGGYQALRPCVRPADGASALLAALQAQGYAIVIATNPVYPADAIRQRLAWGSLPDDFAQYALVTTADNMHFAKPSPAYYAEILARVGVEPDEAVMIGDSLTNDVQAAGAVGLHAFHVPAAALTGFIDRLPELEHLLPLPHQPSMVIPQLQGNIGALFGLIDRAQPHYWHQHPNPDEWSPMQIVCHLLDHEPTVERARLQRILTEDNPFIANPPLPAGPRDAHPCGDDGHAVALRFAQERQHTIDLLSGVRAEDWGRPARHSIFGPTTLQEMAHFTAQHDRLHLNQLCQTLGGCA